MQWTTLYSPMRLGMRAVPEAQTPAATELRTSFVRDYDRLIFSSAFRRLQNKTQVFPLPGAVFVHNRLTHSLEVASVGRSLGKAVGDALADAYPQAEREFAEFYRYELPSVIAAACLAHDIGNPPFGHSGEEAIRQYFTSLEGALATRFAHELSTNQQADFLKFEGNANAFRTLTHAFNENMQGGYRLTYTTLASIVKYPCISAAGFHKAQLATKKSGFFDSELATWQQIAQTLHIPALNEEQTVYARHPFVFLVEAADDICYRMIDLEDAHRLGILNLSQLLQLVLPLFDHETGSNNRGRIEQIMQQIVDVNQKVQYLRSKFIGLMIDKTTKAFVSYQEQLLQGQLQQPLLQLLDSHTHAVLQQIDHYSVEHIYNHRSVVEIELAGYTVIGELLKLFTQAVLQPGSPRHRKLLQLVPAQYHAASSQLYARLQCVVDFVAGMTDLYAVDLYRKLTGMQVPAFK